MHSSTGMASQWQRIAASSASKTAAAAAPEQHTKNTQNKRQARLSIIFRERTST